MYRVKILLICLVAVTVAAKKNTRVIGGDIITVDQAPYIVTLKDADGHFCGGTLVSERFVVTAAHCFLDVKPEDTIVAGDVSTLNVTGVERKIAEAFIPGDYNKITQHMDVAVLKLDGDMTGKDVKPISLCSTPMKEGDMVRVSGWGITKADDNDPSNELRTITVPVAGKSYCSTQYEERGAKLSDTMFCAFKAGTKDSCTMDSGGPLIFNAQLCGVVSWGIGCADARYPGVYTNLNVKTVLDFIKTSMKR